MRNCPDCGVAPGENHQHGCDVERCPLCGGQMISCECIYTVNHLDPFDLATEYPEIYTSGPTDEMWQRFDDHVDELGGRLKWTGEWPGESDVIELGWYCKWVAGVGWQSCEASDPQSQPDLNRLYRDTHWDMCKRKRVLNA